MTSQFFACFSVSFSSSLTATLHYVALFPSHEYKLLLAWEYPCQNKGRLIKESNTQTIHLITELDTKTHRHTRSKTNKLNSFASPECSCNAPIHLEQQLIGSEPQQGIRMAFQSPFCSFLFTDGIGLLTTADLEGTDPGNRQMSHSTEFLLGAAIK